MANRSLKSDWVLNENSFNKLLEALDPDRHRAAEQYEHLRRGLMRYFDWHGSIFSERDADDTIDRVAGKLCEGCNVSDVYTYALGVARNVALESLRTHQKEQASWDTSPSWPANNPEDEDDVNNRFECFDECLGSLPASKRALILSYYEGDKGTKIANRQKLADKAGMPLNRLRIQAHRIREKLETCIEHCLSSKTGSNSR